MQANRRFYEARVLVVALGDGSRRALEALETAGLTGVVALGQSSDGLNGRPRSHVLEPVGTRGWDNSDGDIVSLDEATARADVVVLLVTSLGPGFSEESVHRTTASGREAGNLVAALVVGVGDPESDGERAAMRCLREDVDVLVSVRAAEMAASFLDVLRGGERQPT